MIASHFELMVSLNNTKYNPHFVAFRTAILKNSATFWEIHLFTYLLGVNHTTQEKVYFRKA